MEISGEVTTPGNLDDSFDTEVFTDDSEEMESFFHTGKEGDHFTQAASPEWVTMRAVVSGGPNPLPAQVCLKYKPNETTEYNWVSQDRWKLVTLGRKIYTGQKQRKVRHFFEECIIRTFACIHHEQPHATTGVCKPTFKRPIGFELVDVEKIVSRVAKEYGTGDDAFTAFAEDCRPLQIAKMCLDLTATYLAGKNWNSHASRMGASICDIAAVIDSVSRIQKYRKLNGVPLGGQRHGGRETKYVEYMTAEVTGRGPNLEPKSYLDYVTFKKDHHGMKVNEILDSTLYQAQSIPVPRPVRGHTVDFACEYMGSTLVDGECKLSATLNGKEAAILVLHSLTQLAWSPVAIGLLTTNSSIYMYVSRLNQRTKVIDTECCQVGCPFTLQHPTSEEDPEKDETPSPGYRVHYDMTRPWAMVTPLQEDGLEVTQCWKAMRSEPRRIIAAVMDTIDVLVKRFSDMNFANLEANIEQCYDLGLRAPSFHVSEGGGASTMNLAAQERFIYGPRSMEQNAWLNTRRVDYLMYHDYLHALIKYGNALSDEVQQAIQKGIESHKPGAEQYKADMEKQQAELGTSSNQL